MTIKLIVFLESLMESHKKSTLNKIRLKQLKPYLNDSVYEVFIYSIGSSFECNNKVFLDLKKIGLSTDHFFTFYDKKNLAYYEKGANNFFLKHKKYLMKQENVIVVGAPSDKHSEWLQAANFSFVSWPYKTKKTLTQLLSNQLDFRSDLINSPSEMNPDNPIIYPNLINTRLDYTSKIIASLYRKYWLVGLIGLTQSVLSAATNVYPSDCKELDNKVSVLTNGIDNLTTIIIKLELEQITLQEKMLESEEKQTQLLKVLYEHHILSIPILILTSIHAAIEIPKLLSIVYKYCKRKKENGNRNVNNNLGASNTPTSNNPSSQNEDVKSAIDVSMKVFPQAGPSSSSTPSNAKRDTAMQPTQSTSDTTALLPDKPIKASRINSFFSNFSKINTAANSSDPQSAYYQSITPYI